MSRAAAAAADGCTCTGRRRLLRAAASGPLHPQADRQCCEDNPDAPTHHEVLLPGHLLLKFLREQLETALDALRQQVGWPPSTQAHGQHARPCRSVACCCLCIAVHAGQASPNTVPAPLSPTPACPLILRSPKVRRDLEQRPGEVNLQDEQYIRKAADRMQDVVSLGAGGRC